MGEIGRRTWAIAEGYIPPHTLTLYFSDREPAGPYHVTVPDRRTLHLRFDDLQDPEPVPRGSDCSSVIRSDVPIVVQRSRLDSRQSETSLMTTLAFAGP